MTFEPRRLIQNPGPLPAEPQQPVRDHHPRRQRRRARSQTFTQRNLIFDFELNRWNRRSGIPGYGQGSLPDQIVLAGRDRLAIAAVYPDRERPGGTETTI